MAKIVCRLERGARVVIKTARDEWEAIFLGFTDMEEPYSEEPVFKNWKAVYKRYGFRGPKDAEAAESDGCAIRACFECHGLKFQAYVFAGRWRVGTGAERFTLL